MTEKRAVMGALELRAAGDGKVATISGYAAVFESPADIGGMWIERISPGAFRDSLQRDDVLALAAHDSARVLGRTSSGTLRLREDEKGLAVEIDLPDTSDGRDVHELVRRRDLKGMSFGFVVRHDEWDETVDPPTRTIRSVELIEVSAVANPAYGDTSLALRSRDKAKQSEQADQAKRNADAAAARIAERKAKTKQAFAGIRPWNSGE